MATLPKGRLSQEIGDSLDWTSDTDTFQTTSNQTVDVVARAFARVQTSNTSRASNTHGDNISLANDGRRASTDSSITARQPSGASIAREIRTAPRASTAPSIAARIAAARVRAMRTAPRAANAARAMRPTQAANAARAIRPTQAANATRAIRPTQAASTAHGIGPTQAATTTPSRRTFATAPARLIRAASTTQAATTTLPAVDTTPEARLARAASTTQAQTQVTSTAQTVRNQSASTGRTANTTQATSTARTASTTRTASASRTASATQAVGTVRTMTSTQASTPKAGGTTTVRVDSTFQITSTARTTMQARSSAGSDIAQAMNAARDRSMALATSAGETALAAALSTARTAEESSNQLATKVKHRAVEDKGMANAGQDIRARKLAHMTRITMFRRGVARRM